MRKFGVKVAYLGFADNLLLFSEATPTQVELAMRILNEFCNSSGLNINLNKSKVFFSSMVSRQTQRLIITRLGIMSTLSLGKYLGMPMVHGKATVSIFSFIIDKIRDKLAGWKASHLSLAGRGTLAMSVLCSLGSYFMQACNLPTPICDSIEGICRRIIWGSYGDQRKVHLVNWESILLLKENGGLGFWNQRIVNKALMLKLIWHIVSSRKSLWVNFIKETYCWN